MKTKFIGTTLTAVWIASAMLPLSAEARMGRGGERGDRQAFEGDHGQRGEKRMFKRLKLTEEQRTKLSEIHKANAPKLEELRKKMKASRTALRTAMENDASDEDLKKAHQEVQAVRAQLDDLRFESILTIRKVLTPEQRKKFGEMKGKGFGDKGPRGKDRDDE